MTTIALESGTRLVQEQLDLIRKGGFGSVYALSPERVLKVYHEIDPEQTQKLRAFAAFIAQVNKSGKRFPPEVVVPLELAYNSRKQVVGFTMERLTKGLEPMWQLCQENFRRQFRITHLSVAQIFLAGIPVVQSIHEAGACIGDFNYRNEYFRLGNPPTWRIIDTDSFAFNGFGSEGDPLFLAPELYDTDLGKPVFKPGHDWFSFAVMFFLCLTLCHPFGGNYPKVRTIPTRAKSKISVLSGGVTYPKEALPLNQVLTRDLRQIFRGYFEGGKREPFPSVVIQGYIDEKEGRRPAVVLVPGPVPVQPQPAAAKPLPYQVESLPVSKAFLLLKTNGPIVYSAVIDNNLYVLADEQGQAVYYRLDIALSYEGQSRPERRALFPLDTGARVGHFRGTNASGEETSYVVVNPPYSDALEVWEIGRTPRRVNETLSTNIFAATGHAIFRTADTMLYLMVSSQLFAMKMEGGQLKRIPLRSFRQNQTWFAVDPASRTARALVFYISFNEPVFLLLESDKAYGVSLPALEVGETMQEISVKFDKQGILIIRLTAKQKREFIRVEVLDSTGKVRYSAPPVAKSNHFYTQVHGRLYRTTTDGGKLVDLVLHPTEDGIRQERLQQSKLRDIPTDPGKVVSERVQLLWFYLQSRNLTGIVTVDEQAVYRIG
jgi:hypothetical protein